MTISKLKQVKQALLKAIPKNKSLDLGEDVFLTGMLDGSDKIYGFINSDGEILVESRSSSGWPISELESEDVDYIVNNSTPNILKKIKTNKYEIVDEL